MEGAFVRSFWSSVGAILIAGCTQTGGVFSGGSSSATITPVVYSGRAITIPGAAVLFDSDLVSMAYSTDGARLYVVDAMHGTLQVVDPANRSVEKTIDLRGERPGQIAVHPRERKVYVVLRDSDAVAIVDLDSDAVVRCAVGDYPYAVVFSRDGGRAFVANKDGPSVSVIDTATDTVAKTIDFTGSPSTDPLENRPTALAVGRDDQTLYVAHTGLDYQFDTPGNLPGKHVSAVRFDTTLPDSPFSVASVEVGFGPTAIAVTESGPERILVSCRGTNTGPGGPGVPENRVFVLDPSLTAVPITVDVAPDGILVDEVEQRAFVLHSPQANIGLGAPSHLTVLDLATDPPSVAQTYPLQTTAMGIALTGDRKKLFVIEAFKTAAGNALVEVLDFSASPALQTRIEIEGQEQCRAIALRTHEVFVAHPSRISVIDVGTNTVVGGIATRGPGPFRLEFAEGGQLTSAKLYASMTPLDRVAVLDPATGLGSAPIVIGPYPTAMAFDPVETVVYVAVSGHQGRRSNRVELVDATTDTIRSGLILGNGSFSDTLGPVALAAAGDGSGCFVAGFGVYEPTVNSFTNAQVTRIDADGTVHQIGFNAFGSADVVATSDGSLVCSPHMQGDQSFSTSDQGTLAIVAQNAVSFESGGSSLDLGFDPLRCALTSDENLLYVSSLGSGRVDAIDISNARAFGDPSAAFVSASFTVGAKPLALDTHPVAGDARVFVGDFGADTLSIRGGPLGSSADVHVGHGPVDVEVVRDEARDETRVIVCNYFDGTVSIVDPDAVPPVVVATLAVGRAPIDLERNGDGSAIFVANSFDGTVSRVDPFTGSVTATFALFLGP